VVDTNRNTFLSETNPASNSAIVLRLTTGLSSPLQVSGILNSQFTGTNLVNGTSMGDTITDSDSLILAPNRRFGSDWRSGPSVGFHSQRRNTQSVRIVHPLARPELKPDDSAFNGNATHGYFLMSDTGGNTVYKITATGLSPNMTFVDMGNEFGSVDLSTGVVTRWGILRNSRPPAEEALK